MRKWLLWGALILAPAARAVEHFPRLGEALDRLDAAIDNRASYEALKQAHIRQLEQMLAAEGTDLEQQYRIVRSLSREYEAYQFDKALSCLKKQLELAARLGDPAKTDETNIALGYLYAAAGFYLESRDILEGRIDEERLTPEMRMQYYRAQQKLNNELINYSKLEPIVTRALGNARLYTDRLLSDLPHDSFEYMSLFVVNSLSQWKIDEADAMCRRMVAQTPPSSREFALAAYLQAVLCNMGGKGEEMAYWYARSATADIQACVRDNASIYCLSTYLFGQHDVMRALRYVRIAMDDATFYNAKLRQWQIATYMTTIEQSAQEIEAQRLRQMRTFSAIIMVLVLLLAGAIVYLAALYRQTHRDKQALRERHAEISGFNRRLSELNREIIESNHVKEEYIGLFLTMCSSYIDKLANFRRDIRRKLSRGQIKLLQQEIEQKQIADEELKIFYETFDNAFLHLYPSFVEDFNDLLLDDERITPPKGERLNTELRIFALIRLGITDSSKIAAMLHYSVNTIYNYRAKVKNKAKLQRENFEEAVRHIGSFSV